MLIAREWEGRVCRGRMGRLRIDRDVRSSAVWCHTQALIKNGTGLNTAPDILSVTETTYYGGKFPQCLRAYGREWEEVPFAFWFGGPKWDIFGGSSSLPNPLTTPWFLVLSHSINKLRQLKISSLSIYPISGILLIFFVLFFSVCFPIGGGALECYGCGVLIQIP